MANMCDVQIIARGFKSKADLDRCAEILEKCDYRNGIWTPLFDSCVDTEPETNTLTVYGNTKWSSTSILDEIINDKRKDNKGIVSLEDLAKFFGVFFEILGQECGCNVGEHFVIDPRGQMIVEEYFDYGEYWPEDYETYSEFVKAFGPVISEEEFKDNYGDYVSVGKPNTPFGEYINGLSFGALV